MGTLAGAAGSSQKILPHEKIAAAAAIADVKRIAPTPCLLRDNVSPTRLPPYSASPWRRNLSAPRPGGTFLKCLLVFMLSKDRNFTPARVLRQRRFSAIPQEM
jgi:hypothetical protein